MSQPLIVTRCEQLGIYWENNEFERVFKHSKEQILLKFERIKNLYWIWTHTAASVELWFAYQSPYSLNTLGKSPDMIPREYLGDNLVEQLHSR